MVSGEGVHGAPLPTHSLSTQLESCSAQSAAAMTRPPRPLSCQLVCGTQEVTMLPAHEDVNDVGSHDPSPQKACTPPSITQCSPSAAQSRVTTRGPEKASQKVSVSPSQLQVGASHDAGVDRQSSAAVQ